MLGLEPVTLVTKKGKLITQFERVESKDDANPVKCYTMMETDGKIQWVKEAGYEQIGPVPRRCTVQE